MKTIPTRQKKSGTPKKSRIDVAHLDELIEEATVDFYNDEEQLTGIYTMMEENLEMPFDTEVLGMEATITEIDLTAANQIVAVCKQGKHRQRLPILDLPMPKQLPKGAEWIEAYRRWAKER